MFIYTFLMIAILSSAISGYTLYLYARILWALHNKSFSKIERAIMIAGEAAAAILFVSGLALVLRQP